MKHIVRILLFCFGLSSLYHPAVRAQDATVNVAQFVLVGSILGFLYDLNQSYIAYKKKPTEKTHASTQKNFSSFYYKQIQSGQRPVTLAATLTGLAALLYVYMNQPTNHATQFANTADPVHNNTSSSSVRTLHSTAPSSPHVPTAQTQAPTGKSLTVKSRSNLTVIQQKRDDCVLHSIFNAYLLARNAPAKMFTDKKLFERFYDRALEIIRTEAFHDGISGTQYHPNKEEKNGNALGLIVQLALLQHNDIQHILGVTPEHVRKIVLFSTTTGSAIYKTFLNKAAFSVSDFVAITSMPDTSGANYGHHATAHRFVADGDGFKVTSADSAIIKHPQWAEKACALVANIGHTHELPLRV